MYLFKTDMSENVKGEAFTAKKKLTLSRSFNLCKKKKKENYIFDNNQMFLYFFIYFYDMRTIIAPTKIKFLKKK